MNQPDKGHGPPKINVHKKHYERCDVREVLVARQKLKISGVAIGDQTPKELATNALTVKSDRHMIACVAELLSRLEGHSVRDMLRRLPQVETDERRIHRVSNEKPDRDHKQDVRE